MTRLLDWLLDLDDAFLKPEAPLSIQWELPIPAWVLLGLVLVAIASIALTYGHERITVFRRCVLGGIRVAIMAILLAALCRPTLVLQQNRVEQAYVALLVDRSLSMATRDRHDTETTESIRKALGSGKSEDVSNLSRLEVAMGALLRDGHAALKSILQHNGIQLMTFAATAEPVGVVAKEMPGATLEPTLRAITADGTGTNLTEALNLVLNRMHGRRLAAIVLASDGRLTSTGQLDELLQRAADKQIPIYPIRLGSTRKIVDVEIASAKAQSMVFANDLLLVEASVVVRGVEEPRSCTIQLLDELTGTVVDEKTIPLQPQSEPQTVELSVKPPREGTARFRVRAVPLPEEELLDNNTEVVEARVLADRLKVLYVESYPRFEYRFLKNALLRERSIELSVLLLEADENFVQEGTEPIRRFPQTPDELARYHVVLFGDVDPNEGWLTPAQMNMLLDFVGDKGGGFGVVAGDRNAPQRFLGTPLERLIPVNIDPRTPATSDAALVAGFQAELTDAGRESRVLRFLPDPVDNERVIHGLPDLFWVSHTLGAKPGASVLLVHPDLNTATGAMPVVVLGRYGAGKLLFQATDDTWRWRRHTGELLYDGYWVRVMRELMNPSLASADWRYVIRTDRRVYPYGEAVRAQVEILDPRLISEDLSDISLMLLRSDGGIGPAVLEAGPSEKALQAHRVGNQSNLFEGAFLPSGPGGFVLSAPELSAAGGGRSSTASFRVEKPDLELRRLDADHHTLMRIAAATGGKVVEPFDLPGQLGEIRDRSVQIPDDLTRTLWDSKLVLVLFVLMISIEWGLRKSFGLL